MNQTDQAEGYEKWYDEVISKAQLAESGPVEGTMVIKPYGYAIWERIRAELGARLAAAGAVNTYFPLFIPAANLGEPPGLEMGVVSHAGGEVLQDPILIRQKSLAIVSAYLAKWIQSYRDLPLILNQWTNTVQWESNPLAFIRSTELLRQEGHAAHASKGEAQSYALRVLRDVYVDFAGSVMSLPVLAGLKPFGACLSGADVTYTVEAMMGDGKSIQIGASYELGQHFPGNHDIAFQPARGESAYAWQTAWGTSSRLMGALAMGHGDDNGLRIPPSLAPTQVLVVASSESDAYASQLVEDLSRVGVRVLLDHGLDAQCDSLEWAARGIPIRISRSTDDIDSDILILTRRDMLQHAQRVPLHDANGAVQAALADIHTSLYQEALARLDARTVVVSRFEEVQDAAESGFARVPWPVISHRESEFIDSGLDVVCLQRMDGQAPTSWEEPELIATVGTAR